MMHLTATYLAHPLKGLGYQFFSGIGSSISEWVTTALSFGGLGLVWWRHHNCHVHKCWKLSWHPHPDHGHPVCKVHHPDHPKGGGKIVHHTGKIVVAPNTVRPQAAVTSRPRQTHLANRVAHTHMVD